MGFLKDLVGIAAPIAGTIIGGPVGGAIGGALGGLASGSNAPKAQTATTQQQMDPRFEQILFGGNGQTGLLSQYQGMLNAPRSGAAQNLAAVNAGYIGNAGADLDAVRNMAYKAMGTTPAPTATAANVSGPAWATGNMVDAPAQNNMDLSGSYDSLINGKPGANPYLTGAIQGGINQSTAAFQNMVTDAKSATQDVLGGIRGNSVLAGQFGGSRQGIAEGKAIDSMNTNLARAATQFGQHNTDAAVTAQAGAYNTDRDRQLAATQGLGAQQYGVAQQNAATKNAAEFMNVGTHNNTLNTNAGLQQQTNLANLQSQLTTNAQNNGQNLAGAGLLNGLLGQAGQQVNANDNYALVRAQGVNSMIAPYLGANGSTTTSQPLYNNQAGNALGGAMLGGQIASMFGGTGSYTPSGTVSGAALPPSAGNYNLTPTPLPISSALSNVFKF